MNRKAKLIIGSITLALLMLAGTQVVLAWGGYVDVTCRDGTGTEWGDWPSESILVADILVVSEIEGDYTILCGPSRIASGAPFCDVPDGLPDDRQIRACATNIDSGYYLSRMYLTDVSIEWTEPTYIEALNAYCSNSFDAYISPVAWFVFEEQPTAWSLGVEGAFTTTQMQQFFSPDPVGEGGSDFIPNSGEWLTNITDYALSWLQTINQDDFLFFLMAFGLVNYIISWIWKQLSGASVMGEAQAWRGMFDDGEE
jgi:hypothetical protein